MLVVSILTILILIITIILILGGSSQRKLNRKIEKERKEAIKMAKKEMKNKEK